MRWRKTVAKVCTTVTITSRTTVKYFDRELFEHTTAVTVELSPLKTMYKGPYFKTFPQKPANADCCTLEAVYKVSL